jgi:hypothetical protein
MGTRDCIEGLGRTLLGMRAVGGCTSFGEPPSFLASDSCEGELVEAASVFGLI